MVISQKYRSILITLKEGWASELIKYYHANKKHIRESEMEKILLIPLTITGAPQEKSPAPLKLTIFLRKYEHALELQKCSTPILSSLC